MQPLENTPQGSAAWHTARAKHFCASEAAAALGLSKYTTRKELLRQKATGLTEEVSPAKQRIFDAGHEAEALARPIAESIANTEFYPVVATLEVEGMALLASFDGIDILDEVVWENKLLNQSLIQQVQAGDLEPHYYLQLEQQLLVSGAKRALFTTSDGTPEGTHHLWYESKPERREQLIKGWRQFAADLAAWQPSDAAAPVKAQVMDSLPTVVVQVQGALTIDGNLPAVGDALRAFIARIPQHPETDQEFADAEAACKALKKAEDGLEAAETQALAQISDVEVMRRTVADLRNLARTTRLATEKLVKAEKDARRTAKVMAARSAFQDHVQRLQLDTKGVILQIQPPDFAGAIKGLSSLSSIEEKLTAALIEGKAQANTLAGRVVGNLQMLDSLPEYGFLFPDRQELAHKDEVLELLIQKRVSDHQAAAEAESERKKAQEQAKAQAEAQTAQVIASAKQAPAMAPIASDCTLTLGQITARLAPISLTAAGLSELGFEPCATLKAAKLYRESDFPAICRAIATRVIEAAQPANV